MDYPEDFKQKMVERMLPPNNEPISKIAREEGIAEQTLRNWQKAAREKGVAAPGKDTTANQWSTEDKFLTVVETAKMNESELAEYARQKGLYVEQIKAWKDACFQVNGGVAKEASSIKNSRNPRRRKRNWRKSLVLMIRNASERNLGGTVIKEENLQN